MTTAEDLRTTLRRLADLCAEIQDDLEQGAYPDSGGNNLGAAPVGPKSKAPCSVATLDYIITDVSPRIRGWATELQRCGHCTGLPVNQPLNVWCAWMSRHRETLIAQSWADDAATELADLTAELDNRLHPPVDTKHPDVGEFATAEDIAHATGRSVEGVRKWCQRNKVEHWDIGGVRQYRTSQVHYQYEHRKPA
ncbi:hypothetical protein AALF15_01265 [Corynebacteriaceae bacterium 7-707]